MVKISWRRATIKSKILDFLTPIKIRKIWKNRFGRRSARGLRIIRKNLKFYSRLTLSSVIEEFLINLGDWFGVFYWVQI